MTALFVGCLLGLVQGMRHAFEPDHVTAVSTLIAEHVRWRRIVAFAALWGLGHAATLLVVGGTLSAFRAELPTSFADTFELLVAAMLIALGTRALVRAWRGRLRASVDHEHDHGHEHAPLRGGVFASAARPLGVGIVHGLAGSGALAALAMASFASRSAGLAFIFVYGMGATLGMVLLASVAVFPLTHAARTPRARAVLVGIAGACSITLGGLWGFPIALRLAHAPPQPAVSVADATAR